MLHLRNLERWRSDRKVVVFFVKGVEHARWEPTWPRIPWEEVAHGARYRIYADSVQRCKQYKHNFLKELRPKAKSLKLPSWVEKQVRFPRSTSTGRR